MFLPRISRFSLTNDETWPIATREVLQRRPPARRARPTSIVETSASDWLKLRTVWSFLARVLMKPSSSAAEPNSSSLLSSSVALSLLKSWIVWWNCAPWPPKFLAVDSSRSDSAPFLLAPVGSEGDGQVVDARVDLVQLERHRGALLAEDRAVGSRSSPSA